MRQYVVTFHKTITDSTGHDRRVLQHQAIVRARAEAAALRAAQVLFREAAGVADWRLRADTCEVLALADAA